MDHICLIDPLAIIDCIEFNDRFRFSDILADMAFLIMDLEFSGGNRHAQRLWAIYAPLSNNAGQEALLAFYKVYRAYVRGKVISFQSDDDRITSDGKDLAVEAAQKYFDLARSYIDA
jgi:aminoglycoside phosphotransferase family enzyme